MLMAPTPMGTAAGYECPACGFDGATGYGPDCTCPSRACSRAMTWIAGHMAAGEELAPPYSAVIGEYMRDGKVRGIRLHCLHCEHSWDEMFESAKQGGST